MTSEAYARFLEEYHAEGRQKLEGYTLALFQRMSAAEKQSAYAHLLAEVKSSSPAAYAMAELDPVRAGRDLGGLFDGLSREERLRAFNLAKVLLVVTGERRYLGSLIDSAQAYSDPCTGSTCFRSSKMRRRPIS